MAKGVALISEELVSSYYLQNLEIRIENDIQALIEKSNLPDDLKVKFLGQLITRYNKTVHTPPDPIRVIVSIGNYISEIIQESVNLFHRM